MIRSHFLNEAQLLECFLTINQTKARIMSTLGQKIKSELTCGETEGFGIGDGIELTVLEINGDDVVLRIAGVDESQVVVVGGSEALRAAS